MNISEWTEASVAVAKVALAQRNRLLGRNDQWHEIPVSDQVSLGESVVAYVEAAAPIIEKQVRAALDAELAAEEKWLSVPLSTLGERDRGYTEGHQDGILLARQIARGER